MRKYIKGKDGKFKGSVPSAGSIPSAGPTSLPSKAFKSSPATDEDRGIAHALAELKASGYGTVPATSRASNGIWNDFDLTLDSSPSETGGTDYYFKNFATENGNEAVLGNIEKRPEGGYLATFEVEMDGDLEEVNSEIFLSKTEAEAWVQDSMQRSADYIVNFDNDWREFPGDIDRAIHLYGCDKDFWYESGVRSQPKNEYGIRGAQMRGVTPHRSVDILGTEATGYSIIIKEHKDELDEEGKCFMLKHASSFKEAIAFGRYVGSGAADHKRNSA